MRILVRLVLTESFLKSSQDAVPPYLQLAVCSLGCWLYVPEFGVQSLANLALGYASIYLCISFSLSLVCMYVFIYLSIHLSRCMYVRVSLSRIYVRMYLYMYVYICM